MILNDRLTRVACYIRYNHASSAQHAHQDNRPDAWR